MTDKLVLIDWEDSSLVEGWRDVDHCFEAPLRVTSVGWVVGKNSLFVALAATKTVSQNAAIVIIPRSAIRRIRKVKR